jgi:hypothetical protein
VQRGLPKNFGLRQPSGYLIEVSTPDLYRLMTSQLKSENKKVRDHPFATI